MTFTDAIYASLREGAIRSAEKIVPIALHVTGARSIVDVGCGEGWFARAFAARNVAVTAYDETVEDATVDGVHFNRARLPVVLPTSDLAVCLEVAEHLPADRADELVESLCKAAPAVLFSAAIPAQGGVAHVNEQWPDYWAEKFGHHSYFATESLRNAIWNDDDIELWYRQNLLLFAPHDWLSEHNLPVSRIPRSVVHPALWLAYHG